MKRFSVLLLSLCILSGCGAPQKNEKTIYAMDTVMCIRAYGEHAEAGIRNAEDIIFSLDNRFSVTNPDSEISRLNKSGTLTGASEDLVKILSVAESACKDTDGAFNICIYPILRAWGFTTGTYHVPDSETLTELLTHIQNANITTDDSNISLYPGTEIDLGGIAKGYACGAAAQALQNAGVTSALLDLGGNIQAIGQKPDGSPWHVAVRDPQSDGSICTVAAQNISLVTSGSYQRYFEENGVRYHHIIDPKTGQPAQSGLLSVTIVCADPTLADALSTALFVMGEDSALDYWHSCDARFEAIFVTEDNRVVITKGLSERITNAVAPGYTYEYVDR